MDLQVYSAATALREHGYLCAGFSKDAIHWEINHEPIRFEGADPDFK